MKLFRKSRLQQPLQRSNPMKVVASARPNPCPREMQFMVKGPNGHQVGMVTIWVPLSIMASSSVKAAGGSPELAQKAAEIVLTEGNQILNQIANNWVLHDDVDVFGHIQMVARKTHKALLEAGGDESTANFAEAIILGGGELIISNVTNELHRTESINDTDLTSPPEDAQTLASSILRDFDDDSVRTISNFMADAINKNGRGRNVHSTVDSTSTNIAASEMERHVIFCRAIDPMFGWSALLPAEGHSSTPSIQSSSVSDLVNGTLSERQASNNEPFFGWSALLPAERNSSTHSTQSSFRPFLVNGDLSGRQSSNHLRSETSELVPTWDVHSNVTSYSGQSASFKLGIFPLNCASTSICDTHKAQTLQTTNHIHNESSLIKCAVDEERNHSFMSFDEANWGQNLKNTRPLHIANKSMTEINEELTENGDMIGVLGTGPLGNDSQDQITLEPITSGSIPFDRKNEFSKEFTGESISQFDTQVIHHANLSDQSYIEGGKEVDDISFLNTSSKKKESALNRLRKILRR